MRQHAVFNLNGCSGIIIELLKTATKEPDVVENNALMGLREQ